MIKRTILTVSVLTLLTSTGFSRFECPESSATCVTTSTFLKTYVPDSKAEERQGEVNLKFVDAASEASTKDTMRLLLDPPQQEQKSMLGGKKTRDNPLPTPEALDNALLEAAGNGNIEGIKIVLGSENVKNTQAGINTAYKKAIKSHKLNAAQAILDHSSIQPNSAGLNDTLTTVVQLKKPIDTKKQMIEFIYSATVKPTKAHTQAAYNTIMETSGLQEIGEWFASLAREAGIEIIVTAPANNQEEAANSEESSLTDEDKALIAACKTFNKRNVKDAIVGKASQLTQPGLNKAIMTITQNPDPNYMHYSDFMSSFRKGNIQFSQETADSLLLFAVKTEQTNLLLQFDRSRGYIDTMYTREAMDQAIMKIVDQGKDQLLRAFTSDLPANYPTATERGLRAAFAKAKQLNTVSTCPKGRIQGCMETTISYLKVYGKKLGVALN